MQCPPTKASRPSMTTSLRWSRSLSTPRLRSPRLWKNFTRQPAARNCSIVSLPIPAEPVASSSTRTCLPVRAWALNASATREPSDPFFHRKVSKCTECCALRMPSISASKNAPFSNTSTELPPTAVPRVRPDTEGTSASIGSSHSTFSTGARTRFIDQMNRARMIARAGQIQPQKLSVTASGQDPWWWPLLCSPAQQCAAQPC